LLSPLAFALGCNAGGQTGDSGTGGSEDSPCDSKSQALELDEVTPLGYSAADLLRLAQGKHVETAYRAQDASGDASELTLEVTYEGARFVTQVGAEGVDEERAASCADVPGVLLVDVTLHVVNVDEGIDAKLHDVLQGTPTLVDFHTRNDDEELQGHVAFSEWGTTGQFSDPGLIWPSPHCVETWPIAPDEGEPSAQEFVDWMASLPPLSFEQQDAEQLLSGSAGTPLEGSLSISSAFESICGSPGPEAGAQKLRFDATVGLVEEDRSYSIPVEVDADFDGERRSISASYRCAAPSAEFAETCGSFGVDLSAYEWAEEYFGIQIHESAEGAPVVEGVHSILGKTECAENGDCEAADRVLSTTFDGGAESSSD
jgi:hypothetical protein